MRAYVRTGRLSLLSVHEVHVLLAQQAISVISFSKELKSHLYLVSSNFASQIPRMVGISPRLGIPSVVFSSRRRELNGKEIARGLVGSEANCI